MTFIILPKNNLSFLEPTFISEERKNIHELDPVSDRQVLDKVQSVACLVNVSCLEIDEKGNYRFRAPKTLKEIKQPDQITLSVREYEKFGDEIAPGDATAFLVHPRFVLTAGHNFPKEVQLEKVRLIFGFIANGWGFAKDVYEIKRVVICENDASDYALLKLKKEVEGRVPLTTHFLESVAVNSPVFTLGHSFGMSMKLARGTVQSVSRGLFKTDLRTGPGSSGSPVFDGLGRVVGIHREGHLTIVPNNTRNSLYSILNFSLRRYAVSQRLSVLYFVKDYLSALNGDSDAQYKVGMDYRAGIVIKKDRVEGLKWLKRAASKGEDLEYICHAALTKIIQDEEQAILSDFVSLTLLVALLALTTFKNKNLNPN